MRRLIGAELMKHHTTRTTAGLAAGMLVLAAAVTLLHALALPASQLATHDDQMRVFGWGGLGTLFAGLVGAMSITSEVRHGTIHVTLLATPRRARVLAAKAAAAALVGAGFGLLAQAGVIAVGAGALAMRGAPLHVGAAGGLRLVAGGVAGAALWAVIGVGLGALVRNQVAVLIGMCAWMLLVENVLLGQLPGVGQLLPGAAAAAIGGTTLAGQTRPPLLAASAGALLLAGYTAVAIAAAAVHVRRTDMV